jgi:hypothetical protein
VQENHVGEGAQNCGVGELDRSEQRGERDRNTEEETETGDSDQSEGKRRDQSR